MSTTFFVRRESGRTNAIVHVWRTKDEEGALQLQTFRQLPSSRMVLSRVVRRHTSLSETKKRATEHQKGAREDIVADSHSVGETQMAREVRYISVTMALLAEHMYLQPPARRCLNQDLAIPPHLRRTPATFSQGNLCSSKENSSTKTNQTPHRWTAEMCLYQIQFCVGCGQTIGIPAKRSNCHKFFASLGGCQGFASTIRLPAVCQPCATPPPPPPEPTERVFYTAMGVPFIAERKPENRQDQGQDGNAFGGR